MGMKHLLLWRHAKSSWSDPALRDFDRPLNLRGQKAAQVMAHYLCESLPPADEILCSTAQRTRETLAALMVHYVHPCKISMLRELYLASTEQMLSEIRKASSDVLLVIAHNPGMEDCAAHLCSQGEDSDLTQVMGKFPTAACAHIRFDIESWKDVKEGSGVLEEFIKPKDLSPDV